MYTLRGTSKYRFTCIRYNEVRVSTGSHVYVKTGYEYLSKTAIVNNADMSGINVSDVNLTCSGRVAPDVASFY